MWGEQVGDDFPRFGLIFIFFLYSGIEQAKLGIGKRFHFLLYAERTINFSGTASVKSMFSTYSGGLIML